MSLQKQSHARSNHRARVVMSNQQGLGFGEATARRLGPQMLYIVSVNTSRIHFGCELST